MLVSVDISRTLEYLAAYTVFGRMMMNEGCV